MLINTRNITINENKCLVSDCIPFIEKHLNKHKYITNVSIVGIRSITGTFAQHFNK